METKRAAKQDWGLFEPVRGLVEPCADLVQPVLTGNVMYGLLVGLLVAMWFGFGSSPRKNVSPYGPEVGFYSAAVWQRTRNSGVARTVSYGSGSTSVSGSTAYTRTAPLLERGISSHELWKRSCAKNESTRERSKRRYE